MISNFKVAMEILEFLVDVIVGCRACNKCVFLLAFAILILNDINFV